MARTCSGCLALVQYTVFECRRHDHVREISIIRGTTEKGKYALTKQPTLNKESKQYQSQARKRLPLFGPSRLNRDDVEKEASVKCNKS
jgi:hypothetical protein